MGPMHNSRLGASGGGNGINGVANITKIQNMCETNQWDTFFNQLYAIKVVENIDRNIVGNIERADTAKDLADQVAQTLDCTPLSELEDEKCLERARHYAKTGTEPFASNFLRMVEQRLVARTEAAAQGWALMEVLAHGSHTRLGKDSSLFVIRENSDVLHLIAQHVTESA